MDMPDWSDPPAGLTPCLKWMTANLHLVLQADDEKLWTRAEKFCQTLIPELRQDLEGLRQELIEMGDGPEEMEPIEIRFAAANDCYFRALELIEEWFADPDETLLGEIQYQVDRGASLLEQADSLNYNAANQNTVELSG